MALINWQIPSFEQSNPLLMGFMQGQRGVQNMQDIYRQGIENQNLPAKLREALMAQQLQNQQQQITNQYLPQEKQLGIQHQSMINQYYPKLQESLLSQRGLGNEMTRMQIDALKRQNTPEALARAAELEQIDLDKQRAQAQLAQEQVNIAKLRQAMASGGGMQGYPMGQGGIPGIGVLAGSRGQGSPAGKTFMTPEGPVSYPTAKSASKFQAGVAGTEGMPQELEEFAKAYAPFAGYSGAVKRKILEFLDSAENIAPDQIAAMAKPFGGLDNLYKFREMQTQKIGVIDRLIASYGLSSTNYFGQQMKKTLDEIPYESAKSYTHRMMAEARKIGERAEKFKSYLAMGIPLKQAYERAGLSSKEAEQAASFDYANNPGQGMQSGGFGQQGLEQEPEIIWR